MDTERLMTSLVEQWILLATVVLIFAGRCQILIQLPIIDMNVLCSVSGVKIHSIALDQVYSSTEALTALRVTSIRLLFKPRRW